MIEAVMESKLLDPILDKSCYILVGSQKSIQPTTKELEYYPLTLCGMPMKSKTSDKYTLGIISTVRGQQPQFSVQSQTGLEEHL